MKRIRIGKDIEIHWPILTNGEQVTLEGRDLHLVLHLPSCMETPLHFEPQGNIAVFTISGNMQKQLGAYRLTMWENKDKSGQTAVDYCDAFELVPTTCMEGGNDNNLTTETVNLDSSDLIVGLPGPSAYDLYKKHNPDAEISEEEYANAPIDAADAANEAAKAANEAVDKIGDINEALAGKVDKEEGKGLSSNDYTDDDKEKLDGLSNYDDTEIRVQLSEKASKEEVADAAEKTLSDANYHTDERIEETKSEIATGLLEFGQEVGKAISVGLRGVPAGRQKQYGHSRPENANRLLRQDCSVLSGGRRSCRLWDAGRGDDYRAGSGCMVAAVGRGAVADGQRSLIRAALRSGQSDIVRVGESDRQNGLHGIFFRIS